MGVCASRPQPAEIGQSSKPVEGDLKQATVTFQANADAIRHFKSGHHNDDESLQRTLNMTDAGAESFRSRAASFASSVSEGGLAAEAFGDAIGAVLRDASPAPTRPGKQPKRRSKQKSRETLSVPGATPSPRHSSNGTSQAQRNSAGAPAPSISHMTSAPMPYAAETDPTPSSLPPLIPATSAPNPNPLNNGGGTEDRARSAPQHQDSVNGEPGPDQPQKERQRRPTVTFEAAVSDAPTGPRTVVRERNKSRLKVASQPGQAPSPNVDSSNAPSPTSDPASIQSIKSCRSIGKNRGPTPPVLPMVPMVPAAKGGACEPGLWVLRRTGNVRHKYILADALGRGQFGAVCVAVDRTSGEKWACKSVSKRRVQGMHDFSMADVLREVEVLYTVGGHPGVVGLREVYEDDEDLHLIMELCEGGDWFERLINFGRYTEAEAAATIRSMLEALSYCHSLGVMHRDIKPENIMFVDRTEGSAVKLTDFGLAALFTEGGPLLTEVLGSAYYVAPEVLREAYSKEADIWSTGIVLFIALGGYAPFDGANEREVFSKILHEPLQFKDASWSHISMEAKDVISGMLTKDPKSRATIKELLAHPWFATCAGTLTPHVPASPQTPATTSTITSPQGLKPKVETSGSSAVNLDVSLTQRIPRGSIAQAVAQAVKRGKIVKVVPDAVVARLQQFTAMNAFKRQARRVLATYLPEEEVIGLWQVFKDMDRDGDGLLTLKELQQGLADRGVHITDANAKLMLARTDLDGDGAVDYGEFLAATLHLARLERDERLYRAFRYFDKTGTGFITHEELESGLSHLGKVNVDRILQEVDKDGDGRICYTEFCDMLRSDPEPHMLAFFADNPLESAPSWGAWGEHTESGRLVLAIPPDSVAPSRALSCATSRNASGNERTSYASLGAVSIRRSLGGNLLFGSRNARASGTGQAPPYRASQAGRPSYGGQGPRSMAGSSRFGSMRAAAMMAAAQSDNSSGRSSSRTMASGDSGYILPSHRSALQGQAAANATAMYAMHAAAAQRLQDGGHLEVVTELESNCDSSSRLQPLKDSQSPSQYGPSQPRSQTEGGVATSAPNPFLPSPFSIKPQPPAAMPTAWGEPGAAATAYHPRHGAPTQQRGPTASPGRNNVRGSTEGGITSAARQQQQMNMLDNTAETAFGRTSAPDLPQLDTDTSSIGASSLWRQVQAVAAQDSTSPTRPGVHTAAAAARAPISADSPAAQAAAAQAAAAQARPGSAQP